MKRSVADARRQIAASSQAQMLLALGELEPGPIDTTWSETTRSEGARYTRRVQWAFMVGHGWRWIGFPHDDVDGKWFDTLDNALDYIFIDKKENDNG